MFIKEIEELIKKSKSLKKLVHLEKLIIEKKYVLGLIAIRKNLNNNKILKLDILIIALLIIGAIFLVLKPLILVPLFL